MGADPRHAVDHQRHPAQVRTSIRYELMCECTIANFTPVLHCIQFGAACPVPPFPSSLLFVFPYHFPPDSPSIPPPPFLSP